MNNKNEIYPAYQVDSFHQGVLSNNPLLFNPRKGLNRIISLDNDTKILIIGGIMLSFGVFGFTSDWVELKEEVPFNIVRISAIYNSALHAAIGFVLGFLAVIGVHSYRGWKAENIQLRVNSEILNNIKERHKIAMNLHEWANQLEAAMKALEGDGTEDFAIDLIEDVRFLSVSLATKKNLDQVNSLRNLFPDCYSDYHFQKRIDILNGGIMGRRKAILDRDMENSALDEGKAKLDELLSAGLLD